MLSRNLTKPAWPKFIQSARMPNWKKKRKKKIRKNKRKIKSVRDLKSNPRVLINEPIGGDSNDEKSVSLPGSERESRRGFRLVARRIITRNQSSQIVSPVYKVYFDVSQRGYRIGKLEIPIGYWMHTVVHIGSSVAKVAYEKMRMQINKPRSKRCRDTFERIFSLDPRR